MGFVRDRGSSCMTIGYERKINDPEVTRIVLTSPTKSLIYILYTLSGGDEFHPYSQGEW